MINIFIHKLTTFAQIGQPCQLGESGNSFFGFPSWWKYVDRGERDAFNTCVPKPRFPSDIWAIVFAVIDMLLYLAGIVAVVMIILAGASYIMSGGDAEKTKSAKGRIINSLLGLAVVLIASAAVSFIGNSLIN